MIHKNNEKYLKLLQINLQNFACKHIHLQEMLILLTKFYLMYAIIDYKIVAIFLENKFLVDKILNDIVPDLKQSLRAIFKIIKSW